MEIRKVYKYQSLVKGWRTGINKVLVQKGREEHFSV